MRRLFLVCLYILSLIIIIFISYLYSLKVKESTLANGAHFEPVDCWFNNKMFPDGFKLSQWTLGLKVKRIECGYLSTRKEQEKSYFRLPIVIIRDSFWRNSQHPILNIEGGPGSSSGLNQAMMEYWLSHIAKNNWHHDMVLFDARGTGLSQPALHCDHLIQGTLDIFAKNLLPEEEVKTGYQLLENCYQQLADHPQKGKALQHLGTVRSATDLADLANLLKVKSWHLYGTSYGTRLALEVVRSYPDNVASLILDSVYPQEVDGEETLPDLYLDSVNKILSACQSDSSCDVLYPDLKVKLLTLFQRLHNKPITLVLKYDHQSVPFVVTPSRFFSLLYYTGYDIFDAIVVPRMIDSFYEGEAADLTLLAQNYLDSALDKSFSNPVYSEVECNENEVNDPQAHMKSVKKSYKQYPILKRWQLSALKNDFCEIWGSEESKDDFHQPVMTDKPVLIFAGALDSATPVEWGRALAQRLPNREYHEFKASGHAVLYNVNCAKDIVRRFLNPKKHYPKGCQSESAFKNGQEVLWLSDDTVDTLLKHYQNN
ncbi:MAG: alpha/beta fold hydrolase [Thiotrichaceae bacterium]|nr:alpha/beta fold hydrolase [Thiotrichaceae bacterium]